MEGKINSFEASNEPSTSLGARLLAFHQTPRLTSAIHHRLLILLRMFNRLSLLSPRNWFLALCLILRVKVFNHTFTETSIMTLLVEKFEIYYTQDIASFGTSIPADNFQSVCSETFWPPYLIVKEYSPKPKSRNAFSLPLIPCTSSSSNLSFPCLSKR